MTIIFQSNFKFLSGQYLYTSNQRIKYKNFHFSYLFINLWMKCISGNPIEGWQLDIDRDCNAKVAKKTACPLTFVPFKDMPNKIITKQANLGQNEKCTITLDATDSVARVTFT